MTTEKPDTDELAVLGSQIAILCDLATDLVDMIGIDESDQLKKLHALLYTIKARADHLGDQIDLLNVGR
ncbi:MAG: hypothetical protein P3W90_000710 [Paracoccus sp. (in: a-proteobacteria)]|nr:hypothetical protein [Paracoccus sp. (in: a-proteobacteria)]